VGLLWAGQGGTHAFPATPERFRRRRSCFYQVGDPIEVAYLATSDAPAP